jgi:hypothetical protein
LISDIPAGDGKIVKPFFNSVPGQYRMVKKSSHATVPLTPPPPRAEKMANVTAHTIEEIQKTLELPI